MPSDYILVQCSNHWEIADLNSTILKQAGFQVVQSTIKAASGRNKILASFGAKLFGIGAKLDGEIEKSESTVIEVKDLELDLEDVNDIIAALSKVGFDRYIVLEDFHYLPDETQKDFAVSLKAFHEASDYCFIIIGVWLDENRLIVYNGDLTGRVLAVDADKWSNEELLRVIDDGAALLRITFTEEFKINLIKESFNSVYIIQEVCREACSRSGIKESQSSPRLIGETLSVKELVRDVVDQQTGRYMSFITQFAQGFQETRLEMFKWLLYPILTESIESLEAGLPYARISRILAENHPSGNQLNPGNLTQALQSTASLQVKKNIKPIILDYDQTNRRLNVVDKWFFIWLANQDSKDLVKSAGFAPTPDE